MPVMIVHTLSKKILNLCLATKIYNLYASESMTFWINFFLKSSNRSSSIFLWFVLSCTTVQAQHCSPVQGLPSWGSTNINVRASVLFIKPLKEGYLINLTNSWPDIKLTWLAINLGTLAKNHQIFKIGRKSVISLISLIKYTPNGGQNQSGKDSSVVHWTALVNVTECIDFYLHFLRFDSFS